jgi:dipeptidyl aminopeptidase/acylaminoacyl peptidase
LTYDAANDRDPAFSPDGTRLVFDSDRAGNRELYVIPASGGAPTRLTTDPGVDRQAAWSVTGAIAFASNRSGDFDLFAIDEQGGGLRPLTQEPGADADPSWAPDGSRLAYAHNTVGADWEVVAVDANGENGKVLAASPSIDHFPSWSPDGTRIAFVKGPAINVMPADGEAGFTPTVADSGTDPNWGPLPAPVGAPDVGKNVTVAPLAGQVLIAPATTEAPSTQPVLQAQLRTANEVPVGTSIDARAGTIAIEAVTTTPDGPGTVGRAEVAGGVFTVDQIGDSEPTLRLKAGIRPCQPARAAAVPPEARMRIRVRGRFRTVGGYGRGAGRGTEWAMRERCDGTIFQVFEGIVLVHDYRRRLSVTVPAGRCYLAATRRRPDALKPRRKCPRVRRAR